MRNRAPRGSFNSYREYANGWRLRNRWTNGCRNCMKFVDPGLRVNSTRPEIFLKTINEKTNRRKTRSHSFLYFANSFNTSSFLFHLEYFSIISREVQNALIFFTVLDDNFLAYYYPLHYSLGFFSLMIF